MVDTVSSSTSVTRLRQSPNPNFQKSFSMVFDAVGKYRATRRTDILRELEAASLGHRGVAKTCRHKVPK